MSFADRFELLDLFRDGEVQTFRARERTTGRDVEAHFSPSSELLAKIDSLSVIDRGSHEGKLYVVTAPLGLDSVGAWRIKASETAPPGEFTQMFQLRQAPEPVAAPAARAVQTPAASEAGEFTRVFKKPAAAPAAPPARSGEPGEFTRMFQKPVPEPPKPASEEISSGAARPSRVSVGRVVAAIVIIWAIAVFLIWRRLY